VLTVALGLIGAIAYGGSRLLRRACREALLHHPHHLGVALVGLVGLALTSPFVTAVSSYDAWFYGAASGLAGAIGIGLLYGSLAIGPMSILSPATAFISAIVPVSVGLSMGEGGGASFYIAIVLALVAVVLVGFVPEKGAVRPRPLGLLMAAGSGTFIGFTVILIDLSPADSGLIPLLANRMVSSSALIIATGALVVTRIVLSRTPRLPGLSQAKKRGQHDRDRRNPRCGCQRCRHLWFALRRPVGGVRAYRPLSGGHNPSRGRGAQRTDRDHPVGRACAGPSGQRTPRLLDALERARRLDALLLQLTRNTGLLEQVHESS
jgi:hypothetical protein